MIKNDQLKCSLKKEKIGLDMGSTLRMEEETIEIEVYYAGSRENAPY
jgi:hypothetical protein